MKFDKMELKIIDKIADDYVFDDDHDFKNKLVCLASETLINIDIIRIKRQSTSVENWKTIAVVEIESNNEKDVKFEFKETIRWLAAIKELLLRSEGIDLYLFLAFTNEISIEECLRIESTEQFCRKYVLLPNEDITDFFNRTFLQKLTESENLIKGKDPLENAFSKTQVKYNWLTHDIKSKWMSAFENLTGSDLAEVLLEEDLK